MGRGIEGRLRKLEERADEEGRGSSEEQEKEQWLLQARIRRREALEERDADHARSLIGLFRLQDILPEMSCEALIDRILSWGPAPAGGWSRTQVEREVALTIHRGEPGTERMVCTPAWRESFAAGDELRERYDAAPDEDLAEYYVRLDRIEEEGADEVALAEWSTRYDEPFGITAELVEEAVGPDARVIGDGERQRRINGYLADLVFGEKAYRIARHMERIEKELGLEASTRGEGGS